MKQIVVILMMIWMLTPPVFGQSSGGVVVPDTCTACVSGSTQIKSYIVRMNQLLKQLESVPSKDPGAILGQGNNIITKNTQSKVRSARVKNSNLTITNQSNGVKSDMMQLNVVYDRIVMLGMTLINSKFVWKNTVPTDVYIEVVKQFNTQVGSDKLFISEGVIPPTTTYQQLMQDIIQLHDSIAQLSSKKPPQSIQRNGYQSNPAIIEATITYYECAHRVRTCNKKSDAILFNASSAKTYRMQIVRATQDISDALSREYRDMSASTSTKKGRRNLVSRLTIMVNDDVVFDGDAQTSSDSDDASKKALSMQAQEQQRQKDQIATIKATQEAIKAQALTPTLVTPTYARPRDVVKQPSFAQADMEILSAALNVATDLNLNDRLIQRRVSIIGDTRPLTFAVPGIITQTYKAGVAVVDSANTVYESCKEHCANLGGYCGTSISA